MKIFKVLLDFVLFAVTDKITFFRSVISQLTANPTYPSPEPTLAELKVAVDNFELAILAAKEGGPTAKSAMRDAEKTATSLFRNEAYYVDKEAKGDETKILSSGFHPTKQPVLHDKLPLTVTDGRNSGAVNLDAKKHEKGGAYIWQKSTKEHPLLDSDWETITTTTQASCYVENLTPATYVYFRYSVVTPAGITDYCAPVKKLIA